MKLSDVKLQGWIRLKSPDISKRGHWKWQVKEIHENEIVVKHDRIKRRIDLHDLKGFEPIEKSFVSEFGFRA